VGHGTRHFTFDHYPAACEQCHCAKKSASNLIDTSDSADNEKITDSPANDFL